MALQRKEIDPADSSSQAWTTALATLIPRQARPLSRWSPSRYPNLVNTFFLGLPLILMGICVPYAHYTGLYFDASFAIFRKLDSGLTLAAIAFEEGIQLRATVELPELLAELRVTSAEIVNWWRSMWIVWAAAVAVLLLVRPRWLNLAGADPRAFDRCISSPLFLTSESYVERFDSSKRKRSWERQERLNFALSNGPTARSLSLPAPRFS